MARRKLGIGDIALLGGAAYVLWRYKNGQPILPKTNPLVQIGGTLIEGNGGCNCAPSAQPGSNTAG